MVKRLALLLVLLADPAPGEEIACPPADRPVADLANVVGDAAEERIARVCRNLHAEKGVPLVVVTVPSLRRFGSDDIERFATRLLAAWQFEGVEADGREWRRAALLLVSIEDRTCRIELGIDWGSGRNAECRAIIDERMLPRFRARDHAGGIEAGVAALDASFRGTPFRATKRKTEGALWLGVLGLVALLSVVSLVRRGTQGVAWSFWRGACTVLWVVLASSRRHRTRGAFRLGGFGGGFGGRRPSSRSAGRGATGSW